MANDGNESAKRKVTRADLDEVRKSMALISPEIDQLLAAWHEHLELAVVEDMAELGYAAAAEKHGAAYTRAQLGLLCGLGMALRAQRLGMRALDTMENDLDDEG